MSKTTLDKFSSGWWFFCKENLAESDFPSLSPHHIRFWNRQTTESQPILQSRYSKKSQLSVKCVLHNSFLWHILGVLTPPFSAPQGGEIVMLSALVQSIPEKNPLCLGALVTLFSGLRTDPLYPSAEGVLQNTLSSFPQTLTHHNIRVRLLWKTLVVISPTASSQPSFCRGLWRLGQSYLSLGLAEREKLFTVNIDPALSPRRR